MKYLERLKTAGDEKKVFAGGVAPPKLTEPSAPPIQQPTKPTQPGFVSFASAGPTTKKSDESERGPSNLEVYAERLRAATLSVAQETARRQVLAQLEAHPHIKRAFVNRFEPDGTMIVTLGIRGIGTGELKIPPGRFRQDSLEDYAALLGCIEGAA